MGKVKWLVAMGVVSVLACAMPRVADARGDGGDSGGGSEGKGGGDKHTVVYGKVTGVNAQTGAITFEGKEGTHSVTAGANTRVLVDGKDAKLSDVRVGMYGAAKSDADGNVLMVKANSGGGKDGSGGGDKHRIFTGKVTAVNAQAGTISFTNKKDESQTFTVAADTLVKVNGKPATLADITTDMYGGAKTDADGKVLEVRADGHHNKQ